MDKTVTMRISDTVVRIKVNNTVVKKVNKFNLFIYLFESGIQKGKWQRYQQKNTKWF
jgi:hypothetical protein